MKKLMRLAVLLLSLGNSFGALADCVYQGRSYSTGTTIGDRTCQPDGRWS